MVIKLGLLGRNISHSKSPELYQQIYGINNVDYRLFDFDEETSIPRLDVLFKDLDGLNITAPYKEHFLSNVEIKDVVIQSLKAINCIGHKGKKFYATNTDYSAMKRLLADMSKGCEVLILGDGAMSRVTQKACEQNNLRHQIWSRKLTPLEFESMPIPDRNVLVVNCCARSYVFNHKLPKNALFWDLNYSHSEHERLFKGSSQYVDGLNLLREQALDAAAFWSSLKN